jgi:Bacterial Ig-like domain
MMWQSTSGAAFASAFAMSTRCIESVARISDAIEGAVIYAISAAVLYIVVSLLSQGTEKAPRGRILGIAIAVLAMSLGACGGGGSNAPQLYSLGGSVFGLSGAGLQLRNAGANLSVTADGEFTFPTQVAAGTKYSVTVAAQPLNPAQNCAVSNGSGVIGAVDIASIEVTCATVITPDTAASITTLGNSASETLMQFASFMGERLTYLSGHLASSVTETCFDPYADVTAGSATYTFKDNDGSRSLTPGDVVTIMLAGCLSRSMADHVSGTVTLTLVPPASTPQTGLSFAATAVLDSIQLSGLTVNGSLSAEYTAVDTAYTVKSTVGSSPITLTYQQSGGFFPTDTVLISNASLSKVIDYTLPRYSVLIAADYQSQRLQGQFSVATPLVLSGRLGVYPDTGMEVFSGGPSVLRYAAQNVSYNENVVASLDQSGSRNFVDLPGLFWEQGINGFPWWEPRGDSIVSPNSRPSYSTTQLGMWQMALMFTEPQEVDPTNQVLSTGMDVDTPIKMFFNGPVDPSTAAFIFNTATYAIPGQVAVPANVAVNGPMLTLTAQSQLQQGEPYTLNSVNRVATTWSTSGAGAYVGLQLTTLNNLEANAAPSPGVASPGQTVQLRSTGSFSTNSTIAGYSWVQTNGTAVVLSGGNTATASFIVPASSHSGDALHFGLTITDANGETDSVPVTVFVMTDLTQPFLYYRAAQVSSVGQEPEGATLESSANGTVTTVFDTTYNTFRFIFSSPSSSGLSDELQFQPGVGSIVPGTYTSSDTPGGNPFSILSLGQCDSSTSWNLTIQQAVPAPDGTAAQFSADFTLTCPSEGQPPYSGSVRVNSTVPLP